MKSRDLEIERERYGNKSTKEEERYWKLCKLENNLTVEDEFHFLMVCPLFEIKLENILESIYKSFPVISQISLTEQFLWLMSQENVSCTNEIAKFITQSMKLRSEELEKMISPENVRLIRTTKKKNKKQQQQLQNPESKQELQTRHCNVLSVHILSDSIKVQN